ncbi:GGDEF domain-containing protein [Pseudothermotoga sp. U03pept]|uniref:GGDEF domain-containing protein n=1 Tax=Pseudothermotoga sp. U03pept TaxID=3447012 RepID=UPI003F03D0AD
MRKSIFSITSEGLLLNVIADDFELFPLIKDGKIASVVEPNSLTRFFKFLADLRKNEIEVNWDINLLINNYPAEFVMTGVKVRNDDVFVLIVTQALTELSRIYEELLRIDNEQINQLRDIMKKYFQDRRSNENLYLQLLDEMAKLNNELINVQRELSKKNTELEQLKRKLEEMVIRDELTKLYNRRAFNDIISREYAKAKRFDIPLTLVFMDLNNFKLINDAQGHEAGDKLLINFSELLLANTRANVDYVFRFGGDEFILLLVGSNAKDAEKIMQRINEKVEELNDIVTAAYGIVEVHTENQLLIEELIEKADRLMYENKKKMKS